MSQCGVVGEHRPQVWRVRDGVHTLLQGCGDSAKQGRRLWWGTTDWVAAGREVASTCVCCLAKWLQYLLNVWYWEKLF